jgi:hypothetical protein
MVSDGLWQHEQLLDLVITVYRLSCTGHNYYAILFIITTKYYATVQIIKMRLLFTITASYLKHGGLAQFVAELLYRAHEVPRHSHSEVMRFRDTAVEGHEFPRYSHFEIMRFLDTAIPRS